MEREQELKNLIQTLSLVPLPVEGGFYRESYRSADCIEPGLISPRYSGSGPRAAAGAIYYLITPESFSRLHKLKTDELWHFYAGGSAEQFLLYPDGSFIRRRIGMQLDQGEEPFRVVPAGVWQATRLLPGEPYALFGTTMAPAYDDSDVVFARADELAAANPEMDASLIWELACE